MLEFLPIKCQMLSYHKNLLAEEILLMPLSPKVRVVLLCWFHSKCYSALAILSVKLVRF